MSIYVTSDHHFGHENIISHCNRPFTSAHDMDEILIKNWNAVVPTNGIVYYLGDFTFHTQIHRINYLVERLNGQIRLIPGNHDKYFLKKFDRFSSKVKEKITIYPPYHTETFSFYNKKFYVVMMHFPIERWDRMHHGSFHLHGHCHGTMPDLKHRADVGVDTERASYYPIHLPMLLAKLENESSSTN